MNASVLCSGKRAASSTAPHCRPPLNLCVIKVPACTAVLSTASLPPSLPPSVRNKGIMEHPVSEHNQSGLWRGSLETVPGVRCNVTVSLRWNKPSPSQPLFPLLLWTPLCACVGITCSHRPQEGSGSRYKTWKSHRKKMTSDKRRWTSYLLT